MVIRKTHDGYVLLVMLVMILGVGSSWLGISMHSRQALLSPDSLSERDAQRLMDARQSLLSYATLYPWLYGPSGAGPAHLPCPDTDGYGEQGAQPESGMTQRRDGSNPPCASLLSSEGYLPRHTVLPASRYLFHSEPWQRFHYQVAGNVVNNPVNRVVNLELLSSTDDLALARISLRSSIDSSTVGQVIIRGQALRDSTAASVAAWVKARVATSSRSRCVSLPNDGVASDAGVVHGAGVIPDAGVVPGSVDADGSVEICSEQQSPSADCDADRLFSYLLDQPVQYSSDTCLVDNLQLNTLEGVSATRHWFVRNLWHDWVDIGYGQGCGFSALPGALPDVTPDAPPGALPDALPQNLPSALADSGCELHYLPNSRFNNDPLTDPMRIGDSILLQWKLAS